MGKLVFNDNSERNGEIQKNPQEYYRKARVLARERAAAQLKAERSLSERKVSNGARSGRVMFG